MSGQVIVQPVPEPHLVLLIAAGASGLVYRVRRAPEDRRHDGRSGPARIHHGGTVGCIAILGVLIGLFLPAVQRVRESANYTVCRHHLRQLALATHNYETAHGYYPGVGTEPRQDSALVRLLPYLELDAVARQIDPTRPLFIPSGDHCRLDPAQAGAGRTVVRLFLCPSDDQAAARQLRLRHTRRDQLRRQRGHRERHVLRLPPPDGRSVLVREQTPPCRHRRRHLEHDLFRGGPEGNGE